MGGEDESAWVNIDGSVSRTGPTTSSDESHLSNYSLYRMAEGLGMTKEEWRELRNQVDDSFWVMRVIGKFCTLSSDSFSSSFLHRVPSTSE